MKKIVFILLLAFPFLTKAQDSCKLKKSTDPYTKETRVTTGFVPFNSDGVQFSISIEITKTEIDFFLWIKDDSKCFDNNSDVQVTYSGERIKTTYKNTGSVNCDGAFHFTFRNSSSIPSNLKRLMEKKVASMKFKGRGGEETQITFTEEQMEKLQQMTSCAVNEARALQKK